MQSRRKKNFYPNCRRPLLFFSHMLLIFKKIEILTRSNFFCVYVHVGGGGGGGEGGLHCLLSPLGDKLT